MAKALKTVPAIAATHTELLGQYHYVTGLPAAPNAPVKWLRGQISEGQARNSAARRTAAVAAGALAISAVGSYKRAKKDGSSTIGAGLKAAVDTAPGIGLVMVQGVTNVASHFPLPLGLSGGVPGAPAATRALGKAILPTLAAWSAHRGALEDANPIRGAGRGLIRAVDPTALLTGHGVGEKLYDKAFGSAPERKAKEILGPFGMPTGRIEAPPKNSYERFWDSTTQKLDKVMPFSYDKLGRQNRFITGSLTSGAGAGGPVAPPRTLHGAPHVTYFERKYNRGPKEGVTERVRNTRWA